MHVFHVLVLIHKPFGNYLFCEKTLFLEIMCVTLKFNFLKSIFYNKYCNVLYFISVQHGDIDLGTSS